MSRPSLAGAGVLVTRARDQAGPLVAAVEEAGGVAWLLPALEIVAVDGKEAAGETPDLAVFVSPNAVRHGARFLSLPGCRYAAIGPATAEAMSRAGRPPDLTPAGGYDSESLLAADELADMSGRRVLIVRGRGGRELLADTLRERGATVDYAEVYERRLPQPEAGEVEAVIAAWREGRLRYVTCLSVATLRNLAELLGENGAAVLRGATLVSASDRVLQLAVREDIAVDTLLAQGPEPSDLVRAMVLAMVFPDGDTGQSRS
ncbi:uroporphyrinogen-III synthase [Lentisalinibacter orientalis]|uniref:uroporphyrinogen-III synthase n=1 Tax=Lentisalinibacter orientalis TaxID=2992241 RepID=UPI00386AB8C4